MTTSATRARLRQGEDGTLASSVSSTPWPDPMREAAMHGLVGEIVRTTAPHTEADPAAVVASLLVMFGNAVGTSPHVQLEESRHAACLYVCVVGDTSSGRKGTSADLARRLVRDADPSWDGCVTDGLVSGEGVIHHVRDKRAAPPSAKGGGVGGGRAAPVDLGVSDKRLCVLASEFAQVLATMHRPANTLSPVLRTLWDGGTARTLAKNSPERTTGAHVSILGHITATEVRRKLDSTEIANGFANRFLFIASQRSKFLPRGGRIPDDDAAWIVGKLGAALRSARRAGEVGMTDEAWLLWEQEYQRLASPGPGLLGELLARAPANARRLAMVYALIDGDNVASVEHLRAALAVSDYAAASARHVFGDRVGHLLADRINGLLREAAETGCTRSDLRDRLGNRVPADHIAEALGLLQGQGLARCAVEPSTGGRRAERWYAAPPGGVLVNRDPA